MRLVGSSGCSRRRTSASDELLLSAHLDVNIRLHSGVGAGVQDLATHNAGNHGGLGASSELSGEVRERVSHISSLAELVDHNVELLVDAVVLEVLEHGGLLVRRHGSSSGSRHGGEGGE